MYIYDIFLFIGIKLEKISRFFVGEIEFNFSIYKHLHVYVLV